MSKITPEKSLIFIRSLVIALGIVLLVLVVALLISRLKHKNEASKTSCEDNNLSIMVSGEIAKFESQDNYIIVLTKPNRDSGQQEIIKFDSNCPKLISKITFQPDKADQSDEN